MSNKGRHINAGETNAMARLTWTEVGQIRKAYAAGGVTVRALAARFGVSHGTVHRIVRKVGWK